MNYSDIVKPGSSTSTEWMDRLQDSYLVEKVKLVAYLSQSGSITLDESDNLDEATPTINILVNEASITANTMYTSAELTFTKRFFRITVTNSGAEDAELLLKSVSTTKY